LTPRLFRARIRARTAPFIDKEIAMNDADPRDGLTRDALFLARPGIGLTYDDIIVLPRYVEEPPARVDLKVELAPGLTLNPIISSPMDTVTEWRMAAQMALNGCLGVLHMNLDVEEMYRQVRKVKRFQMGFIWDPVCLPSGARVRHARDVKKLHGFSTIPITEGEGGKGKFLGLITKNCVDLEPDGDRPLIELMIPPHMLVTPQRGDVPTLEEAKRLFRQHPGVSKLPILDEGGGLSAMVNRKNVVESERYPDMLTDENQQLRVAAAVSTHPEDDARAARLLEAEVDAIVIDSSQGGTGYAVRRIRGIRTQAPDIPIVAGNVVTPGQAKPLIEAGACALRVGMGSGSICITQGQYGLGRAQGSAVRNVAGCIADGGIRTSGDMLKALALGARFVMVGSFIAGCDETPSDLVETEGRRYRLYRGMGSVGAMRDRSAMRYGGSAGNEVKRIVAQGVEGLVPAIGPLDERLGEALDGLRGALGQLGCASVPDLHAKVEAGEIRFELRSDAARREGAVHDLLPMPRTGRSC
jgi:IMP dehydrogenase